MAALGPAVHRCSSQARQTSGTPPAHYPGHPQRPDGTPRPPRIEAVTEAEAAFLAIGDGARAPRWRARLFTAAAHRFPVPPGIPPPQCPALRRLAW